jgi:CheY-like chemotaxis protein
MVLLFQSVRELLMNTCKHAGTGAATVTMERDGGMLRIAVRDDGCGFDYAAAAASNGDGGQSSKFGLFSIGERMRALGGSFAVDTARGRGTTAVLHLPCLEVPAPDSEPAPPASAPAGDKQALQKTGTTRVVLVDDHAMVRQGLRSVLDAYPDMEVVSEAADGEMAVNAVLHCRPAVVVMDINMPRMNGIEATAAIKADYPDTVVIGLSVNADERNAEAMKRAGAAMLLTKEAAVEQLYLAIRTAMRESDAERNRTAGRSA